jgi:hypothetical protein
MPVVTNRSTTTVTSLSSNTSTKTTHRFKRPPMTYKILPTKAKVLTNCE